MSETKTMNDDLAAGTGQESPTHEAIENYDAKHGHYGPMASPLAPRPDRPTAPDPKPFGTLKKGG